MNNDISFELETTASLSNYNSWIADSFYPFTQGSLIEIGAGIGTFSELFIDRVDNLTLLEPSHQFCAKLQQKFAAEGHVEILQSHLDSLKAWPEDRHFDCAMIINVLEHIQEDKEALEIIFSVLKPGGHLLLFVPALQSLFSELDEAEGHHRRYHFPELGDKVNTTGFKIIKLRYFDWLGATSWWFLNVVLKRKTIDSNSAILYDRIGIPITRWIERIIKPPFGKNLILVARKIG